MLALIPAELEDLQAQAAELGYLYLPRLIDPLDVAPSRAVIRAVCEKEGLALGSDDNPPFLEAHAEPRLEGMGYGEARWLAVQREILQHAPLRALCDHPTVLALLQRLFGETPKSGLGDLCRLIMPKRPEDTTPPHQDHLMPGETTRTWTAWFPVVDCPLELGPLALLPGSHHQGHQVHSDCKSRKVTVPDDIEWASSSLMPGDVVLFNGFTIHKALANQSETRIRSSLDFRYRPLRDWQRAGSQA